MKEFPFYNFSSFHGKPEEEDKLALSFVSNTSAALFDEHFDSSFSVRHFPNMDGVFLTPKEAFKVTVYYPSAIRDEIRFQGVGSIEPGGSFKIEKYKKIEIVQKNPYYSEGLEGVPVPILWVFEGNTQMFVKTSIATYFPSPDKQPPAAGAERLARKEQMWNLPAYDFRHPASLHYIKPFAWSWFSGEEVQQFRAPTPRKVWDAEGDKFSCNGIFYPLHALRERKGYADAYNFTGDPVVFYWHGPEDAGFGDDCSKEFRLAAFEKATVDTVVPRKVPQVIVAQGEHRIEWFPLYFYEHLSQE